MTTFARPVQAAPGAGPGGSRKGSLLASWLSSTDHKVIGHLYLVTSFGFFLIAGLMAMIIRAQLFGPDNHIVSDQQYNELFFLYNVYKTSRYGQRVTADDPWGYANALEWVTSCPPPRHNFTSIPRIRSERPAFDLHYPHIVAGRNRELERQSIGVGK